MRILIDAMQAGNLSGTGVYTRKLVEHLVDGRYEADYVVLWPKHVGGPRVSTDSVAKVYYVAGRAPGLRAIKEQWTVSRTAVHTRPDIIHYPASIGPWLPCIPPGSMLGRTVVTVHDLAYLKFPAKFTRSRRLYYKCSMVRSARRAAHVIADSDSTRRDLVELAGLPPDRVSVVHLGVDDTFSPVTDPDALERVREKYMLPEKFFLFVGTIEPRKNIGCLIDAFERIAADTDTDLVVAGRRGWGFEPIYQRVERTGLTDRILMPGRIEDEDLPAVYSCATALVWPSLYEGFGLPPLESMACGTPVISSDISVIREVVGNAALLVDPTAPDLLAAEMRRLATDRSLRDDMSGRGLERARLFPWSRTAELTMDVYKAVDEGI